jgi:hypothetical protein
MTGRRADPPHPDTPLYVALDWTQHHCRVPDGFKRGRPFTFYDFQLQYMSNHYLVKGSARWEPDNPVLGPAFVFQRSLLVDPQKKGKGPLFAAKCCLDAVGPALFAGWAAGGEVYRCEDHGCGCGWEYAYDPGEPMGMRWPTPLIQITAFAEDQTENIYRPFRSMVKMGPLAHLIRVGAKFSRILDVDEGRVDVVTSSAQSRLGAPVTDVFQDEVGIWVKTNSMDKVADTQYRGLAGMGGRAALSTNAWDPSEQSVAQTEYETDSPDVYKQFVQPPPHLSYRNKEERRRIHRFVYGDVLKSNGGHVDLDSIEGEAYKLLQRDPAQAERFFGNKIVYGQGAWLKEGLWAGAARPRPYPRARTSACLGFDGSLNNDWTAIRMELVDGYQFTPTYGPDKRPCYWRPEEWPGGEIPRGEVRAAIDEIHTYFAIERGYYDPEDWESEIEAWALKCGAEHVVEWRTNRVAAMYDAIRRFETDLTTGAITNDGCKQTELHFANARKVAKPGQKYILGKPNEHQKIDLTMATILAHEAAADARAEGWGRRSSAYAYSA